MLKFSGLFLVVLAQGFSSYAADDHPRRGIEHMDQAHTYGYWHKNGNGWITGYGYHMDRTKEECRPNGGSWKSYIWVEPVSCPVDKTDGRTLTTDIREAILDDTRFLLALREQRFGEAWRMGLENEQGDMWRRIAEIDARSAIEKLAKQSVFENDDDKLRQAIVIKNQFDGLPLYGDLETLITQTRSSTECLLRQYSEGEGAAEAETRALRNLALRVIGE